MKEQRFLNRNTINIVFFMLLFNLVLNIDLKKYGWNNSFSKEKEKSLNNSLVHGRVISVHKSKYEVITSEGIFFCEILGNIQFQKDPLLKPAVGDWVLLKKDNNVFIIYEILKRKSIIKRQKENDRFPKPIAANVDIAVIIQSVVQDFNINRLNRILTHVNDANIKPIIIFNKIDLVSNRYISDIKEELMNIASDIKKFFISVKTGLGIVSFKKELISGKTIILIGSSGVGKSSLVNLFIDRDLQNTNEIIKKTGKGRHTTTSRRLIMLDNGALVIDTPGTREFGISIDDIITR